MIKRLFTTTMVLMGLCGVISVAVPATTYAADKSCNQRILTFPAWYNGLASKEGNKCVIDSPRSDATGSSIRTFAAKVVLNIIDILMQLVAYASIAYLIIGGFIYLTSTGAPDKMTGAKKTILNAIIGLIIALLAITIVNLVGASV